MLIRDFDMGFDALIAFYSRKMTKATRELWWTKCCHLAGDAWLKGIDDWIETESYWPTPQKLRAVVYRNLAPADRGEKADDYHTTPEEDEFNKLALHLLVSFSLKEIDREQFMQRLAGYAMEVGLDADRMWSGFEERGFPIPDGVRELEPA